MPVLKLRGTAADSGGIIWHSDDDLDRSVWVRVREAADGRFEVVELYLDPHDGPITTDHLRRIPLGRIEAFANSAEGRQAIARKAQEVDESIVEYVARVRSSNEHTLREVGRRRQVSARLAVPHDRRDHGDDFYRRVAMIYSDLVERGTAPAPAIAEANEVPLTTARRWVKEARRRGFLPPGRAGKVG